MTGEEKQVRIDKWLWAVRIFKTRSQAAEACKKGKILISEIPVKPSRTVHPGEIITVKKMPVIYHYRITRLLENRVSAKQTAEYAENLTPEDEMVRLLVKPSARLFHRIRGEGRPTKKERRAIDRLKSPE